MILAIMVLILIVWALGLVSIFWGRPAFLARWLNPDRVTDFPSHGEIAKDVQTMRPAPPPNRTLGGIVETPRSYLNGCTCAHCVEFMQHLARLEARTARIENVAVQMDGVWVPSPPPPFAAGNDGGTDVRFVDGVWVPATDLRFMTPNEIRRMEGLPPIEEPPRPEELFGMPHYRYGYPVNAPSQLLESPAETFPASKRKIDLNL